MENTHIETLATTVASTRTVESIHRGGPVHWVGDGFRVETIFPSRALPPERVSPFVLLDFHAAHEYAPLAEGKRGVGWHPHRGFETVTFAWQGLVAHRDTAGHAGVVGPGDVQWMTAASGVLHEEYHSPEFTQNGGTFEMGQLWVNLPRDAKRSTPRYQGITSSAIPIVDLGSGSHVRVIAGEHGGAHGPAKTFTPITMLDARLAAGGTLRAPLPQGYNALALVVTGEIVADGEKAKAGNLVVFSNDGAALELRAETDAHVLVLAGEPIGEPVIAYGPFVMNTEKEIVEAILDFESGKFGAIPA